MSFSQEKLNLRANTGADETPRCNGCDCHCKFGIHYFHREEPRADMPSRSVRYFCPTIDDKIIKEYRDQDRQLMFASKRDEGKTDYDYRHVQPAEVYAIEQARQIAKLCDHYKTTFTQQHETNLHTGPDGKFCDGCDKRCEFDIHYFYCHTNRLEDWFCPTINGKPIKQYKGPNGQIIDASREVPFHLNIVHRSAKEQAIELAHKIVKYCDHYKTR